MRNARKQSSAEMLLRVAPYAAALIGIAVYLRSVNGPFIWDDGILIEQLEQREGQSFWSIFTTGFFTRPFGGGADYYRPLIIASFIADLALWNHNTLGYHLLNLVLHGFTVLAVGLLTWLTLRNRIAAAGAALLFAVYPVHAESVCWISGRTDVFCVMFLLFGLCAYLAYRQQGRKALLAASLVLVALALLSKEIALLSPVLVVMVGRLAGERSYRRLILDAIPYAILGVIFFVVRSMVLSQNEPIEVPASALARVAIVIWSVVTHFQILVIPSTGKLGYQLNLMGILGPRILAVFFGLIVLFTAAWSNRRRFPMPFFAVLWFLITIAPVSGILGLLSSSLVAQRYLYVPSVGMAILFGWLAATALESRKSIVRLPAMLVLLSIVVGFSVMSVRQSAFYANELRFWSQMVVDTPVHPSAHYDLGIAYQREGRHREAIEAYRRATELDPSLADGYYGAAKSYADLGEYDKAIEHIDKALELSPDNELYQQVRAYIIHRRDQNR